MTQPQRTGLGALEILLCAALVLILGLTMVPEALGRSAAANDAQRLRDIERIRAAIEAFHAQTGRWPAAQASADYDGWDVSHDGAFLPELVERGLLENVPLDPLNDDAHHYRYRVISEPRFACPGAGPWYVLGIRAFQTSGFALQGERAFRCGKRDFSEEFAWVVGASAGGN